MEKRNHQLQSQERFGGTKGLVPWQEDLLGSTVNEDHLLIPHLIRRIETCRSPETVGHTVASNICRAFLDASRCGMTSQPRHIYLSKPSI